MSRLLRFLRRRLDSERNSERGSAPVEFVLCGSLLTLLTLGVLQLGLGLYISNSVQDAASEGARYASLLGNTVSDGIALSEELAQAALGQHFEVVFRGEAEFVQGVRMVRISAEYQLPLLGYFGLGMTTELAGHAAFEWQGQ